MFVKRFVQFCTLSLLLLASGLFSTAQAQSNTPDQAPAATQVVAAAATELLVFEVNRPVTTKDRGFPRDRPPKAAANGNWKTPVNFAQGTFYYRAQIRSQPQPKAMRLQFCIWQYNYRLENCGEQKPVSGAAGTVVTWSQPVQSLWMKNGKVIEWDQPRYVYGIAIKNSNRKPVSDYNGWRWNGENPSQWYPLNIRFTVVVVAKGATFGGWEKYVGPAALAEEIAATASEVDADWSADSTYGSNVAEEAWAVEHTEEAQQTQFIFLPAVMK